MPSEREQRRVIIRASIEGEVQILGVGRQKRKEKILTFGVQKICLKSST